MVGIMPGMADSTAIEAGPGSIGSAIEGREGEQLCRRCLGIGHHVLVLDRQNTRSKFALPEHHQILVSGVMGGDVQKIVGKGIGVGADQIAPFGALAFAHIPSGTVLLPLVQHFVSYKSSDADVNLTAARLIAIRPLGKGYWVKLDAKIPYDWENEKLIPTAEVQLGYNFNQGLAA